MDPQKLSQLDPKLRDAYQRVMGTQLPDLQTPPASPQNESVETQAFPQPPAAPTSDPIPFPAPTTEEPPTVPIESPMQPLISEPQLAINPQPETPPTVEPTPIAPETAIPQQQASNFARMNSEVPTPMAANPISPNFAAPSPTQPQTMAIKKKGGMLTPVMTGIAIVVFIVVYTLFWTKIFNLKLPFLP